MQIELSALWGLIVGILGVTLTILNIIDKIRVAKERASAPEEIQNQRIKNLECGLEKITDILGQHEIYLKRDKERLDSIESGVRVTNKIIIKSLQALTEHALDGNSIEQLKRSKEELDEYLLNK